MITEAPNLDNVVSICITVWKQVVKEVIIIRRRGGYLKYTELNHLRSLILVVVVLFFQECHNFLSLVWIGECCIFYCQIASYRSKDPQSTKLLFVQLVMK